MSQRLISMPTHHRSRMITTPEGIALPIELATRSARLWAVSIDLAIIGFGLLALVIILAWQQEILAEAVSIISTLCFFLVRSFYFAFFELRWQGTTPGKRLLRIRVIDRAGGRLRAGAVFARNMMREIEFYIPVSFALSLPFTDTDSGVVTGLAILFLSVFVLMPFFNKDRLRAGDIVGGTLVVEAPKSRLLPDMAETGTKPSQPWRVPRQAAPARHQFTQDQLDVYGIYELQTLESILRRHGMEAQATLEATAEQIQRKIEWQAEEPVDPDHFLKDFYAALRAHLENKMLLGVRRESKHDR